MLFKELTKLKRTSKITLKNQLKHLTGFFISLIVCAVLYLFSFYDGITVTFLYLNFCIIIIVTSVFFLHIQYLYFNAGVRIETVDNDYIIYYYRNGNEKVIKLDDIISIERYVTFAYLAGGRYILPTDNYNFQKIILKDGGFIIITSLIYPDFNLFPKKTHINKRIFPIII